MEQLNLSWQLDEVTWLAGTVAFLVAAAVSLTTAAQAPGKKGQLTIWLLTLAALATISAGTVTAAMTGWTAVIALWLWLLPPNRSTYWLLLPLLGLWAVAGLAQWPAWAGMMLLVTAVIQMGVWPLSGWRALADDLPWPLAILLLALLPVMGLSLLARFPEAGQMGVAYGLVGTIFGLLGVLIGLRRAWSGMAKPMRAVAGLAQVQVNIAFLAAVWGGREAALAETRLLLAVAVLYLAAGRLQARWQLIGPVVALAALAGLPLTAGFAGLSALYSAWWGNGRFLLILVLAILHVPLVTAGFWLVRRQTAETAPSPLEVGAWLLPAIGLITFTGLGNATVPIWLIILLPFALGLIAMRFSPKVSEVRAILRRAFMFSRPRFWPRQLPTLLVTNVGTALREAARILEGETGLLWLLAFVVILLLIRT
jgi:flagellar basal body-associated protein FliL